MHTINHIYNHVRKIEDNIEIKAMAIRKSKEENFEVKGNLEDLKLKVQNVK